MSRWLRKLFGMDDSNLSYDLPWGRCEAKWPVHGPIPYVTCGKRTNLKVGPYWACSDHLSVRG